MSDIKILKAGQSGFNELNVVFLMFVIKIIGPTISINGKKYK